MNILIIQKNISIRKTVQNGDAKSTQAVLFGTACERVTNLRIADAGTILVRSPTVVNTVRTQTPPSPDRRFRTRVHTNGRFG